MLTSLPRPKEKNYIEVVHIWLSLLVVTGQKHQRTVTHNNPGSDQMAAADGLFRSVYEACLSGSDVGKERRPYHRNCGCALHSKSRNKQCAHGGPKTKTVSYPMRRAWSEGNSLALMASSYSAHSSPSNSSPAAAGQQHLHHGHRRRTSQQLDALWDDGEEEEEDIVFFNNKV